MVSLRRSQNGSNHNIGSRNRWLNGMLMPGLMMGLIFASFVSLYVSRLYFSIEETDAVRQALLHYSEETYIGSSGRASSKSSSSLTNHYVPDQPRINVVESADKESNEAPSETKLELIARIFPNETKIENPPLQDGATTFSACMLVMDDNHRLTEWMAYHYHVLPLRYMIVAVDPRSKTSPTHILNQWRKRGVHIIEWNDRDFWRADLKLVPIADDAELQTKRDRHRGRQKYFYKQCLIRCKKDHRTWVSLHDSDEFLVYNHAGGDKFEEWEAHRTKISRMPRIKPSKTPPTTAEAGAMIHYINQERAAGLHYYQSPCIGVPRTMFGADESQVDHKAIVKQVPKDFHWAAPLMDTLKYRQHATRNDFVKNALGKVIIDVSRVNVAKTPYFMSLHRPIKKLCPSPWINDWSAGLRINHYLGSWHSYSFRDDSRRGNERSWEQWTYKAMTLGENTDDNIRPWLSGLIENEGEEIAADMLQNVGLPANYKNGDDHKWHLVPERLHEILSTDVTIKQDNKAVAFEDWVRQTYRKNPEMIEQRKLDYAKVQAERAAAKDTDEVEEDQSEGTDDRSSEQEDEPNDVEDGKDETADDAGNSTTVVGSDDETVDTIEDVGNITNVVINDDEETEEEQAISSEVIVGKVLSTDGQDAIDEVMTEESKMNQVPVVSEHIQNYELDSDNTNKNIHDFKHKTDENQSNTAANENSELDEEEALIKEIWV